jgi:hypothetical protein
MILKKRGHVERLFEIIVVKTRNEIEYPIAFHQGYF